MTRAKDLRILADVELDEKLEETKRELFTLRFQLATAQSTNTARLSYLKKEIARLVTLKSERENALVDDGVER